jgi:23S rRNA (uracil1939-C5)-methyltransferase
MNHKRNEPIEVQLTGWAYGGEALGRAQDGRMIFAPFCMPGEIVRGTLVEDRDRWARMLPQQWLQTSPGRLEPRCPHFTECGGCHYQHLPYEQQLVIKATIVKEQLQRIGKLSDPPVSDTLPSPQSWEYRNHMRYQVLPDGSLGLVRYNDTTPFSLETCLLPEPELKDLWARIDLPPQSPIAQVSTRTGTSGDPMIILHGDMNRISEVEINFPSSIIWQDGDAWRVLAGESAISFEINGHSFRVSPPSFFQVNTSILIDLVQQVMSVLQLETGMNFFDLYAGVGLFSAFAAQQGARVFAVEESSSACADFEVNLGAFEEISLYEASVGAALPAIDVNADIVLVDPPRSGLSRAALDAILKHLPERLAYLSCDLGTLARDAKRLQAGGYELERVKPIDLFPQTFHIETLSSWRRR